MSISYLDYCTKEENANYRKGEYIDVTRKIDGMPILQEWELLPNKGVGRKQRSFYRKAHVFVTSKGYYLMSYDTIVCMLTDNEETGEINVFRRYWMEYSNTTMKHINAFVYSFNLCPVCKKEWESLEYNKPYCLQNVSH